ncbi:MAG: polysaccharide biosynthesis/export family protein [Planctomycetota bacterium]|nr:polysaccharide biosynthesis/export family protein [Planctomycetota bacterium]
MSRTLANPLTRHTTDRLLAPHRWRWAPLVVLAALAASCAAPRFPLEGAELRAFMEAGPVTPEFDEQQLLDAITPPTEYRVVPGDLLLVRGPSTLFETGTRAPGTVNRIESVDHYARVARDGQISMPVVGTLDAAGKTLLELETSIADAAYPKYLRQRPAIVVQLKEPFTVPVTVYGAVEIAGVHRLASDQLTLSGALSAAGGIVETGSVVVGARKITIYSPEESDAPRTLALPIRGLNVPFYDAPLRGGERIEVERYEPDRFTVVGLVAHPGAHQYPPETQYNLMQALAIAGGVDRIADPPYATIFRKDLRSGAIIPATFHISGDRLVEASDLRIKPGDVIAVGHTKGSWTRSFLATVVRLNFGVFIDSRQFND